MDATAAKRAAHQADLEKQLRHSKRKIDHFTSEPFILKIHPVRVYVTSTQYERLCNAFAAGADRVEASVILFNRVIDRAAVARVVGRMSCFEQSFFGCRIGWRNVLGDSLQSYTMHYRLDLSCDEQMSVAKHLVTCAVREYGDVQVIRNVTINGRRLSRDPVEDDTLVSD